MLRPQNATEARHEQGRRHTFRVTTHHDADPMSLLCGREDFQSDGCSGQWWRMAYVRPMRPSHHADEFILQVHLRQVRELDLGTAAAITT